jgi:phosphatidate cytidylyltransferase
MCALSVHELLWTTGAVKQRRLVVYGAVMAALVPFWYYFSWGTASLLALLFLFLVLVACDAITLGKNLPFEEIALTLFGGLLVPMMLSTLVLIADEPHGRYLVLFPIISAFVSDAFALFAGMLFGKHKLAPKLSPKKTIEGSIGGFVGSVLGCLILALIVCLRTGAEANVPLVLFFGLLGSLFSQVGDLFFSYIKREYDIKDYGKILPGHGGVLDRFDSMVFCAPLAYLMVHYLPFFTF